MDSANRILNSYALSWPSAIALLTISYLVSQYFRSSTYKLRHIPSVGGSGIIASYLQGISFIRDGQRLVQEGYDKYFGIPFKVSTMGRYIVVASGQEMMEDIRRASDEQLSFRDAVAEVIQSDYMLGKVTREDPFHIAVVRSPLTRNLGYRFPDVKDEIMTAFSDLILPSKEWTSYRALPTVMQIVCRTSNRLFVGLPLCRNPDYRKLHEKATIDVVEGARIINKFPRILRPLVGRYLTKVPANIKQVIDHVGPIIAERIENEKKFGPNLEDDPNDLISWLLQEAKGPQRNIENLALRVLTINFAAIHTTSMALTNALYDLATHPEYVEPMREEVEAVIASEGWTKVAMGKMRKVDSFLKESQRLAVNGTVMDRKVLKDFTFSNGVTVPAGSFIAMAALSSHLDEDNYADADKFNGFRFSERRDEEGEGTKHQMVALSSDFMNFGTGRHACPGRFFAVNELKAMLAHILMTYDIMLPNNGPRPLNMWFNTTSSPNPSASVLFRKRM